MTPKINPDDVIACFICGTQEHSWDEEQDFELVTLFEVQPYVSTISFAVCPKCKRSAIQKKVGEEFMKRYRMVGKKWESEKEVDE